MTIATQTRLHFEDITFEFEAFLKEHEEKLPEGLDPQYIAFKPVLENPFKNIIRLPKAISTLPINAVLHQNWKNIFSYMTIIILLTIPAFFQMIYLAALFDKIEIAYTLIFFILLGNVASAVYLKGIYATLENLVEEKKAPWLVERVKKIIEQTYQRNWSKRLYSISIGLALIMEVPMTLKVLILHEFDILFSIIWLFLVLISYFGLTLMIYVMLMSYLLVYRNTRIYDIILSTIIDRVKGYTDEHESILTKKNYEVVGVLSDTPGLSIRSLGDIPVGGLSAAIFVVNAAIFLLFSPFLIEGPVADFFLKLIQNFQRMADSDPTGLSLVIVLGIFLSSLAAFGAVLMPLIRITRVMSAFKVKALIELDPFLFEEITSVALKRDTIITNETQVLFMLRSYIHTMKVSPVHPIRVVQLVLLAILYAYRAVPVIIGLISG